MSIGNDTKKLREALHKILTTDYTERRSERVNATSIQLDALEARIDEIYNNVIYSPPKIERRSGRVNGICYLPDNKHSLNTSERDGGE